MSLHRLAWGLGLCSLLTLGGCSTLSDSMTSLNPFKGSGPKMAELPALTPTADTKLVWSANVGKTTGGYAFSPALYKDRVYVASGEGSLTRLDNGTPVWRINVGQALSAGVGADSELVVVGTAKGDVLAFSAEDGKPAWQAKVSSEVLAPPAVSRDGVAVRSGDNRIFLLDVQDGKRKWVFQRATPPLSLRSMAAPVFSDRFVFAGFPGGKLVALDLKNGAPVWEGTVALPKGATELERVADIVTVPAFDGRQVCSVAYQGRIACFDLTQGGNLLWARDFSSASGLILDGRYLFVTDDKGAVHALDRNTGGSIWKQDRLANRRLTGPAVRRGLVAVGDGQGYVHFLSREDGAFAARVSTDGTPVVVAPLAGSEAVIIQTTGGLVQAIDAQ